MRSSPGVAGVTVMLLQKRDGFGQLMIHYTRLMLGHVVFRAIAAKELLDERHYGRECMMQVRRNVLCCCRRAFPVGLCETVLEVIDERSDCRHA
jgi:hypothetical protein